MEYATFCNSAQLWSELCGKQKLFLTIFLTNTRIIDTLIQIAELYSIADNIFAEIYKGK
jgi:hypothetical protein